MKKCLILLMFSSIIVFASDDAVPPYNKISYKDRQAMVIHIICAEHTRKANTHSVEVGKIKNILDGYAISYPSAPTLDWLSQLRKDLGTVGLGAGFGTY